MYIHLKNSKTWEGHPQTSRWLVERWWTNFLSDRSALQPNAGPLSQRGKSRSGAPLNNTWYGVATIVERARSSGHSFNHNQRLSCCYMHLLGYFCTYISLPGIWVSGHLPHPYLPTHLCNASSTALHRELIEHLLFLCPRTHRRSTPGRPVYPVIHVVHT